MFENLIHSREYKGFRKGDKVKLTEFVQSSFNRGYPGDIYYITEIDIYAESRGVFFVLSKPYELRKHKFCRMDDIYAHIGEFSKCE